MALLESLTPPYGFVNFDTTVTDPEQPIDNYLMDGLMRNPLALFNGESTIKLQTAAFAAGCVDQAAMGAGSIGQTELKTTTATQTTTSTSGATKSFVANEYAFAFRLKSSHAAGSAYAHSSTLEFQPYNTGTAYGCYYTLRTNNVSYTASCQERYVTASPPWDLGNGLIPLFVYALVEKGTGNVTDAYSCIDPPWAIFGKQALHPQNMVRQNGKVFIKRASGLYTKAECLADPIKLQANMDVISGKAYELVELTMEEKISGMNVTPHPFLNYDPKKHVVVLLDPCGKVVDYLYSLCEHGSEGSSEATDLLHAGRLSIGNAQKSGLITPPGVMGVSVTLK